MYALGLGGMFRVLGVSLYLVCCVFLACWLGELGCGCFLQMGDVRLMGVSVCEVW